MSGTLAIVITFTALATVAVALRLFARLFMARTAGWDDGLVVIALMTDWVFLVFAALETHYGLGKPQSQLSRSQIVHQLKAFYLTIPFYCLTLILAKLSMLVLYLRLFPTSRYRILTIVSLVVVSVIGLWMTLSSFLFCIPVSDFWNPDPGFNRCLPRKTVWYLNAALQIVTDVWVVVMPMPMLASLKLPRRQKIAVVLVFALGIFVCVMSVVRLWALAQLVRHSDVTRYNTDAAIWSSIEANVAVTCASLPPLRPLIARVLPSFLRSSKTPVSSSEKNPQRPVYDDDKQKSSSPFVPGDANSSPDGGGGGGEPALGVPLSLSGGGGGGAGEQEQQGLTPQRLDRQGRDSGIALNAGIGHANGSGIQATRQLRLDPDVRSLEAV